MGWEDRDYYRGGGSAGEYFGNPALFFSFSLPFGRWFGVPIRLTFWLLIVLLFHFLGVVQREPPLDLLVAAAIFVGVLILHEFGHRFFTHRVGGTHEEFLLWPAGALNHPSVPPDTRAMILAHGGGIIVNAVLAVLFLAPVVFLGGSDLLSYLPRSLLLGLLRPIPGIPLLSLHDPSSILLAVGWLNLELIVVNLLPFYWFDGGYLWEGILSQFQPQWRAVNITCIAGMVVAGIGIGFGLFARDILLLIMWVLLFSSSYSKRREATAGYAGFGEVGPPPYKLDYEPKESARRKPRWPSRSAVKRAAALRKEQQAIDAILEKVHQSGMQSLTWLEQKIAKGDRTSAPQRRRALNSTIAPAQGR